MVYGGRWSVGCILAELVGRKALFAGKVLRPKASLTAPHPVIHPPTDVSAQ